MIPHHRLQLALAALAGGLAGHLGGSAACALAPCLCWTAAALFAITAVGAGLFLLAGDFSPYESMYEPREDRP